jgi:hypothetical protein
VGVVSPGNSESRGVAVGREVSCSLVVGGVLFAFGPGQYWVVCGVLEVWLRLPSMAYCILPSRWCLQQIPRKTRNPSVSIAPNRECCHCVLVICWLLSRIARSKWLKGDWVGSPILHQVLVPNSTSSPTLLLA